MAEENSTVDDSTTDSSEETTEVHRNPLEISDEEIANMSFPTDVESEKTGDDKSESDDEESGSDPEASDDSTDDDTSEDELDETDDDSDEESEEDTDDSEDTPDGDKEDLDDNEEEETSTEEETDTDVDESSLEFKAAQLDKIFQPFNANGKQMQVDNADDAIRLMQMGANYNKKMAALKPNLKLMKMLDNNDLLDEGKLNYLIDLSKKDPDAITKLIKDSGINPLDIDVEKDAEYTPNTHNVGDNEVELDNVLESIKDTPTYQQTVKVISTEWDESSRRVLVSDPNLISVINDQIANGVYGKIDAEVNKQRTLGKLNGVTDFQAYLQVGAEMQQAGLLTDKKPENKSKASPATVTKKVARKQDESKLKKRKKAASTTRSTAGKKAKQDFNPLSMPDEEFEKMASGQYG